MAYESARDVLAPEEAEEDGIPLMEASSAGRHGSPPELAKLPSLKAEANFIAHRLQAPHRRGRAWKDVAVIYRSHFIGEEITQRLRAATLPVEWLNGNRRNRNFHPAEDSVKVMTMHSSKGLEFPVGAIPGVGFRPCREQDPKEEARLLYVAMTRAMDELLITWHQESAFVAKLGQARARLAA